MLLYIKPSLFGNHLGMLQAHAILTYWTFMWLSPLHVHVSNQNALLLLLDNTLKKNEFQGVLILCQCLYNVSLKDGNIESNFLCI